jgi:hypothetical protein
MTFRFQKLVQVHAAPTQRPAIGFRELTLHASAVAEAAERFLHERLARKRQHQISRAG